MTSRRDWLGSLVGLAVFGGGVWLLWGVFRLAQGLFSATPEDALGLVPGKPLDLQASGGRLTMLVVRCLLLLVMGVVASLLANKGVSLYARSLAPREKTEEPA